MSTERGISFFFFALSIGHSKPTKGVYDEAIGFITVAFFAIVTCTCSYRRRMRLPTTVVTVEEETAHPEPARPRTVSFRAKHRRTPNSHACWNCYYGRPNYAAQQMGHETRSPAIAFLMAMLLAVVMAAVAGTLPKIV